MRKLALLLTLCLVVTMLPGVGYTEDELAVDGLDMQIEDQLSGNDLQFELSGEDVDGILTDDGLDIDLDVAG